MKPTFFCMKPAFGDTEMAFRAMKKPLRSGDIGSHSQTQRLTMSYRKLLVLALLAGVAGSAAACADVTAPQENSVCPVSGGGQTCGGT